MRAVRIHDHGGPESLSLDDIDRPEPGPDDVIIEVAGAGVNPVDTYIREGAYEPYTLPLTPGADAAGEVVAVGEDVVGLEVGDLAVATGLGFGQQGAYAEYAAATSDRVARLPDGVDPVATGGAGIAAVTSWRALVDHAGLDPAETVLVHGGSGGVGHAAVQLASAMGATVVATAAPQYHDEVAALGADAVLDYGRDDLADAVTDAAGGEVDVVLDHRLDEYFDLDVEVGATGVRIVAIGEEAPTVELENPAAARLNDVHLTLMSMFNTPDLSAALGSVASMMAAGDLVIEVAHAFDLEDAGAAQETVMSESFLGKVVITP
jgi:NADPH:quinone reductase-like Zn-dependent oxidoreductase